MAESCWQGQRLWARQFDVEGSGTHIFSDAGTAWILGPKTEDSGTLLETKNGGKTELLGSFSYTVGPGKLAPIFVIEDARAAFSFAEVCYTGDPFATIVLETQGNVARQMPRDDPRWGGHSTLYSSGGSR